MDSPDSETTRFVGLRISGSNDQVISGKLSESKLTGTTWNLTVVGVVSKTLAGVMAMAKSSANVLVHTTVVTA
jgi:hypothetical protein